MNSGKGVSVMSGSRYGVPAFDRPHRMISGVCAAAATLAEVPVWMVRVAAVVLLVFHACLTLPLYFIAAFIWRRNIRTILAGTNWSTGPLPRSSWTRRMP
jgi:phage shock protein PspC (stress-responsive transcriptional regulator)